MIKIKICCEGMNTAIKQENIFIPYYYPAIKIRQSDPHEHYNSRITHCPWCGTKITIINIEPDKTPDYQYTPHMRDIWKLQERLTQLEKIEHHCPHTEDKGLYPYQQNKFKELTERIKQLEDRLNPPEQKAEKQEEVKQ